MAAREPDPLSLLTLEDFEAMPEPLDERLELDRGVLVREPLPGASHGAIAVRLGAALLAWAREGGGGTVLGETGYVLRRVPPTVRGPDVSWVSAGRTGYGLPDGFFDGAPDLAVEVVSPSNRAGEIRTKVLQYLGAGARQVWVVHPRTRAVVVHTPDGAARTLGAEDVLDAPDLLPGFALPLPRLFGA